MEITGPVERKMMINALNSGARVFMADFEDANSPTWSNNLNGHLNLIDAIEGTISFTNPDGKQYRLQDRVAYLMVRPRGWHLPEKHLQIDGRAASASLAGSEPPSCRATGCSSGLKASRRSRLPCNTASAVTISVYSRARRVSSRWKNRQCRSVQSIMGAMQNLCS